MPGRCLRSWGLTPRKPLRRAFEKDPAAIRRWLTEECPVIQAGITSRERPRDTQEHGLERLAAGPWEKYLEDRHPQTIFAVDTVVHYGLCIMHILEGCAHAQALHRRE
jgi:hypothetical protein